jgi:hypothetical protein
MVGKRVSGQYRGDALAMVISVAAALHVGTMIMSMASESGLPRFQYCLVEGDTTSGVDRKHLEISITLANASLPRLIATPNSG